LNILQNFFKISELRKNKSASFGHAITLSRNVGIKVPMTWRNIPE